MKILSLVLFASLLTVGCTHQKSEIEWISTTPEHSWKVVQIKTIGLSSENSIQIFPSNTQQQIDGFGGCFNELGWDALSLLPADQKEQILQELFNPENGCKFNICRMPIGANDYAVDWYSHNETSGDYAMEYFSIERDKQRLIPYIKAAQKILPDLKIWGSPWCPPSWMKTNNHYACRPDVVNDLKAEGAGEEMISQFRMEKSYLNAYALYFSKFIKAYQAEGIDIYAVHVQNEPNSCQNFPSCIWRPNDLATFIGNYLGPQFEKDQLATEIWLGTIERPQIERITPILGNPEAAKYITGVGFQWAGKGAIAEVQQKYPGFKLMQTETECGNGSNDWDAAEHTFELMKHYFSNGANAYMYWNMVLNETGKSQWGWKQNSMISIHSETKEISYNKEFYLIKHFSAFIEPGAHKIETSNENCFAFKNNNSVVIIIYNNAEEVEQSFQLENTKFSVTLEAKSFNTFVIKT